jgi:hypothetical protein
MRLGDPIAAIPNSDRGPKGMTKYAPAYQAARDARGQWVPVDFETAREAGTFYSAAKSMARADRWGLGGLEAKKRKTTVYIRVPESTVVGQAHRELVAVGA